MLSTLVMQNMLAVGEMPDWLYNALMFLKVLVGFSVIIFVHELGHFLAAKWVGVRVDRFAIGFGTRLFGWRGGEGFTFGNRPDYSAEELEEKGYSETDYCFKIAPIGGYVKMLGQDDVIVNEETGEMSLTDDPRSFNNRTVGQRMLVVSAGVIFNLLFAAFLFICVFMVGKEMTAPIVGLVQSDSPQQGLLMPGDKILEVDGSKVNTYEDMRYRVALSGPDVRLKIERNGAVLEDEIVVDTTVSDVVSIPSLDVQPATTTKLLVDREQIDDLPHLQAGDEITSVDGVPVDDVYEIYHVYQNSGGRTLKVEANRPKDDSQSAAYETVTCYDKAPLYIVPAKMPGKDDGQLIDYCHVLGLRPRRVITGVVEGKPADKAGMKAGDVVLVWGTLLNPTYGEIVDSIHASADVETRVVVLRDGEQKELKITPRRPFALFRKTTPKVGVDFSGYGDLEHPTVADVAPDTSFAKLNIPRGAVLMSIDDRPTRNWYDIVSILLESAGKQVKIVYKFGDDETVTSLNVPGSIVNELDLPPGAIVWSVDGEKKTKSQSPTGRAVLTGLPGNPMALQTLLKSKIGQTVAIRYSETEVSEVREAQFTVAEDNYDPWQMRMNYLFEMTACEPLKVTVSAHGNPFVAAKMGTQYVVNNVWQIYMFLTRLADRSIGTENVAGPVGIISIAVQRAKGGTGELLGFLAFLSVNLAVINFLPMPVMDGGLMVFLLLEKIKGKPLSLKTQMISTLIGLAAIIFIGLYVTIQDIGRFF